MAEDSEDPRETVWHPRFAQQLYGHHDAAEQFYKAFAAGRPHHAWLITGSKGIGKATLAYRLAGHVLGQSNQGQTTRWIAARSHPDLYVLERRLNDSKPRKLKTEISVDDARGLSDFFSHTSSGGWRVGLVDAADDLNTESANALLKLVEEPPPKCLLLLVCNLPGRLLRTMKSRCTRLPLSGLSTGETVEVLNGIPIEPQPKSEDIELAAQLSFGSPGRAMSLLNSEGAKAFDLFIKTPKMNASGVLTVANKFGSRLATVDDFNIFGDLLLDWIANQARQNMNMQLAAAHAKIAENLRVTNAFNLDRRQAVISAAKLVSEALKAA